MQRPIKIPLVKPTEVVPIEPKKMPTGPRPIIPTEDTCCAGVCTQLNGEISDLTQLLTLREEDIKYITYGASRAKVRRQINTLKTKLTALKDFRFNMKRKDICKCIE